MFGFDRIRARLRCRDWLLWRRGGSGPAADRCLIVSSPGAPAHRLAARKWKDADLPKDIQSVIDALSARIAQLRCVAPRPHFALGWSRVPLHPLLPARYLFSCLCAWRGVLCVGLLHPIGATMRLAATRRDSLLRFMLTRCSDVVPVFAQLIRDVQHGAAVGRAVVDAGAQRELLGRAQEQVRGEEL